MASSSLVKLNASSSSWIGQQSFNQRSGSSCRLPVSNRRVSVIRAAGSYTDELIKTAVTLSLSLCLSIYVYMYVCLRFSLLCVCMVYDRIYKFSFPV